MRFYALTEDELHTISLMNTLAIVFVSAGSFLFSLGLGLKIDAVFQSEMTAEARILNEFVAPMLFLISLVGFGLGIWALIKRRSLLNKIRDTSKVINE